MDMPTLFSEKVKTSFFWGRLHYCWHQCSTSTRIRFIVWGKWKGMPYCPNCGE